MALSLGVYIRDDLLASISRARAEVTGRGRAGDRRGRVQRNATEIGTGWDGDTYLDGGIAVDGEAGELGNGGACLGRTGCTARCNGLVVGGYGTSP